MTEELIALGKYLLHNQLAWGNSGNVSTRTDQRTMMITASGTDMGHLSTEDLVLVDIQTGQWSGSKQPSKEVPMHAAIYDERADVGAVIHSSPFWTTLMACSKLDFDSRLFIESMYYIEKIERVEYHHPGSQALGDAVRGKAKQTDVFILRNHGVIVCDVNIKEARMRLETLEMASRMLITAHSANIALDVLDNETVNDFLDNSGYKPRKTYDSIC